MNILPVSAWAITGKTSDNALQDIGTELNSRIERTF